VSRLRLVAAAAATLASAAAAATEGGVSNRALGADTVLAGVMAPPGMRLTTFIGYYNADRTVDGAGNPRAGISNFSLNASAVAPRFQYVWPDATLWGASIETRLAATAYADVNVSFDVQAPGGKVHRAGSASNWFTNIVVAPVLLGWHARTIHQIAGLEVFVPTRAYNRSELANVSTGYASIAPTYRITWLPNDDVEIDGSFIWLYNWKNPETDYHSGQEFNVDYALGYGLTPTWQIGASGYVYKQFTADKIDGNTVPNGGNEGRAVAIGPFVRYRPSRDWGVTLKWQHEYLVENRSSGNRFYLQFMVKLL
jgi:hypothetical protein